MQEPFLVSDSHHRVEDSLNVGIGNFLASARALRACIPYQVRHILYRLFGRVSRDLIRPPYVLPLPQLFTVHYYRARARTAVQQKAWTDWTSYQRVYVMANLQEYMTSAYLYNFAK